MGEPMGREQVELLARIAPLTGATRAAAICAAVGHSRVVDDAGDGPLWRVSCARCGTRLEGVRGFDAHGAVFRRHLSCPDCARNREALTWRDLWEVALEPPRGE